MTDQPKLTPEQATEVVDALRAGNAIVCLTKCWPCQFGQHTDAPHTWMDDDDAEHAGIVVTGHASRANLATDRPCGCWCNEGNRGTAVTARYCLCGAAMRARSTPPTTARALTAEFDRQHVGTGHGPTTQAKAAVARRREERLTLIPREDTP